MSNKPKLTKRVKRWIHRRVNDFNNWRLSRPSKNAAADNDWRKEKNWWKAPVLQGPENDYGDYDYLAERLPTDTCRWEWDYVSRCDDCGKEHRINKCATHYFYCWDGWDSMSSTVCWKCYAKDRIHGYFWEKRQAKKAKHEEREFNKILKSIKK